MLDAVWRTLLVIALAILPLALITSASAAPEAGPAGSLSIRIDGNHFVDGSGRPIRLLGVNRSGTEYACVDGTGIFDGPSDGASIAAIASWHVNAVRVPINEDCWLGINGVTASYAGANYRAAIGEYVTRLNAAGLYAIVDLHWDAPGTLPANGISGQGRAMADRDHALALWSSVATTFRGNPAVVLDLFNEPHDITWDCWQRGCATGDPSGSWQVAGFQTLVDTVRATGARNPILLAGIRWGEDLRGWPHGVSDPRHQLAASWHVYSPGTRLDTLRDLFVRPIAGNYPVVASEIGEKDCAHGWLDGFMSWADDAGISYLAWTWNPAADCSTPPLITAYDGSPTIYGAGFRDHLLALWRGGSVTRVLTPLDADRALVGLGALGLVIFVIGFSAALLILRRRHHPNPSSRVPIAHRASISR